LTQNTNLDKKKSILILFITTLLILSNFFGQNIICLFSKGSTYKEIN